MDVGRSSDTGRISADTGRISAYFIGMWSVP